LLNFINFHFSFFLFFGDTVKPTTTMVSLVHWFPVVIST